MKTLTKLIKDLKLDYVNSDITEKNFPPQEIQGRVEIIKLEKDITSEGVIAEMEEKGLVPANAYELLDWAKDEWNGKDWVVALVQEWQASDGHRHVVVLYEYGARRGLCLNWFGRRWYRGYRFAFVRKSPDSRKLETLESSETLPSELTINCIIYKRK